MKLSVALSLLVLLTCCVIEVASDANYAITFNAQAPIIEFVYQLDIPAVSPDSSNSGDAQAMWAGITTADGQTLFQNVIENQDGGPNSWFMEPVYCCSPYSVLDGPVQVYQSDTLQASVIDDTQGDGQDSQWFDSLYIARNPADGQSPYAATVSLNTTQDPIPAPFTQAMFVIELHDTGAWDWREVLWHDVYIQAMTTDTNWCTNPFANSAFQVAIDAPTVQANA